VAYPVMNQVFLMHNHSLLFDSTMILKWFDHNFPYDLSQLIH
jgi:hypothetical protein